ncbi:hypothetical protein RF679_09570 [Undibacterium cyanobacteriorum]|uniref:Uncharacterized protein n=1 Tax=Undibacterium cyanobacteriorum TaxID=3073561 RepID=A0ABY9RE39_9BURK|nr:hypothetical protein [Undibacterium sp. 20NA77.5]WMW78915.1 hypothetical protein RF679_09570 [Undibacterium sp. 20NA77.5]
MLITKLKIYLFLIFFVTYGSALAENEGLSRTVKIEKTRSFSSKELWNSTGTKTVASSDASISYRLMDHELDHESPNSKSGMRLCALVMVGTGDLGITPVSFRIWTKQGCEFEIVARPRIDSEALFFDFLFGMNEVMTMRIDSNFDVSIDDRYLGKIRLPR